jgi:hypothetical protein
MRLGVHNLDSGQVTAFRGSYQQMVGISDSAAVVVFALTEPDGKLTARSVQAEKDSVKPLM